MQINIILICNELILFNVELCKVIPSICEISSHNRVLYGKIDVPIIMKLPFMFIRDIATRLN